MRRYLAAACIVLLGCGSALANQLDGTWISRTDSSGLMYVVKGDRYWEYFDGVLQDRGRLYWSGRDAITLDSDAAPPYEFGARFSAKFLNIVDPATVSNPLNFWAHPIKFWRSHRYNECERYSDPIDYAWCMDRIDVRQ